jgi:hypothetical protein
MVGRLTLDQVVKVRILVPQPREPAGNGGFSFTPTATHRGRGGNNGGNMKKLRDLFKRKTPQQVPLRPQQDVNAEEQRTEHLKRGIEQRDKPDVQNLEDV